MYSICTLSLSDKDFHGKLILRVKAQTVFFQKYHCDTDKTGPTITESSHTHTHTEIFFPGYFITEICWRYSTRSCLYNYLKLLHTLTHTTHAHTELGHRVSSDALSMFLQSWLTVMECCSVGQQSHTNTLTHTHTKHLHMCVYAMLTREIVLARLSSFCQTRENDITHL